MCVREVGTMKGQWGSHLDYAIINHNSDTKNDWCTPTNHLKLGY